VGTAPFLLSISLGAVSFAATAGVLLLPDAIRGPAVTIGNLQGTALVLLVVTLPVLVVSMALLHRGVAVAVIFWLGATGSIAYQSVLFLFGVPFNSFFFLDVAMLSLSVWSLVALTSRLPIAEVGPRVGARAPVLTGPVQVIDFAFTLPLMTVAAILLLWRPWGFVLVGALLVMLAIETASIGVDQWLGHAADPASPAASAALTPVFAVLTVIGVAVLVLFMRPGGDDMGRQRPG
jgi:hypothetical protein